MKAFDFYDTLATRTVGRPRDIFTIVGQRLSIADFPHLRMQAELKARKVYGAEVNFAQIYTQLPLEDGIKAQAAELELELERTLLVPVKQVMDRFEDGDLIVSDMYHSPQFFADIAQRLLPGKKVGKVFVSGSVGVNKASGDLWAVVRRDYPDCRSHIGDNLLADVKQARRNGLAVTHFTDAVPNRCEQALLEAGGDASYLAGLSKATRLALTADGMSQIERAIVETFASVFAPTLFGFCDWLLNCCARNGLRTVYFLARDGQLAYRICSAICARRKLDIDCRYIYASRQALHLPGYHDIEEAEGWILADTSWLSLQTLALRTGVEIGVIVDAARGRLPADVNRNIPASERAVLPEIIRDPIFMRALEKSSQRALSTAVEYYKTVGITAGEPCAIVDIGWNGRMQASLRNLLQKAGCGPSSLCGLYFSLARKERQREGDTLTDYVTVFAGQEYAADIYHRYGTVAEAAFSADHPTTLGFVTDAHGSGPLFGDALTPDMAQRIGLQHRVVETFSRLALDIEDALRRPLQFSHGVIIGNLVRALECPTRSNGLAFAGFDFSVGQAGEGQNVICRVAAPSQLFKNGVSKGYWREGSYSASGLEQLVRVWRWARHVRDRGSVLLSQLRG